MAATRNSVSCGGDVAGSAPPEAHDPLGIRDSAGPRILHVSGDFPDPLEPFKTKVVRSLVDLTAPQFDHRVVSINRVEPPRPQTLQELLRARPLQVEIEPFEYGTALRYWAPGRGILHRTKLNQLGEWLAQEIARQPQRPDLIIGHKLAIEGIAVRRAAQILGLPYGLSIQGDSDTKIMDIRRDLAGELGAVLHGASVIFPFAPWAWDRVTRRLGVPAARAIMLPCPTDLDQPLAPQVNASGLVSVFHLMSHKRKNLAGLAAAIKRLGQRGTAPRLSIIGGGDAAQRAQCEAIIRAAPTITMTGQKDREEVRRLMNGAIAFVLPSLRETFGLVFVEALFAGAPIIYPRGTAVDGYFDGQPFAIAVDARDPGDIAAAIETVVAREAELKAALAQWQGSDDAKRFQRAAIAASFAAGLRHAVHTQAA